MGKRLTRGQAIKFYCRYECCCNDLSAWKGCPNLNCPLWVYRTGKTQKKPIETISNSKKIVVPAVGMVKKMNLENHNKILKEEGGGNGSTI